MNKDLDVIKGGSVVLWFKPSILHKIFGKKKMYDYNLATLTGEVATVNDILADMSKYGKVWSYVILSPKQDYTNAELESVKLLSKMFITIKSIINMVRPNTFKGDETVYDIIDNKYYKIVSVGDRRIKERAARASDGNNNKVSK